MKALFTIFATLAILAAPAQAATVKQAWNLPADAVLSDGSTNGTVTPASRCLRETNAAGACFTDPDPVPELPAP